MISHVISFYFDFNENVFAHFASAEDRALGSWRKLLVSLPHTHNNSLCFVSRFFPFAFMFPPSSLLPTFIPFTSAHKVFHWSRELEIKYNRVASENMFRSSRDLCPKSGACLISFTARKFAAGVSGKMLSFKLLFDLLLLRGQWNFPSIKENSAVKRAMVEDVPARLRLFLDRPRASLAQIKSNFSKAQSRCLLHPKIS